MCVPFLAPLGTMLGASSSAAAATGTMAALGGLSTVMSAYGQYQQASGQQKMAEYQASMADLQAQDALRRGEEDRIEVGRKARAVRGEQEATMAARGLDISYGTPLDLLQQTDYFGAVDQARARNNARREAFGFQQQATGARATASSINPVAQAGGSLISGLGQVASQWYKPAASSSTTPFWDGSMGGGPKAFSNSYAIGPKRRM